MVNYLEWRYRRVCLGLLALPCTTPFSKYMRKNILAKLGQHQTASHVFGRLATDNLYRKLLCKTWNHLQQMLNPKQGLIAPGPGWWRKISLHAQPSHTPASGIAPFWSITEASVGGEGPQVHATFFCSEPGLSPWQAQHPGATPLVKPAFLPTSSRTKCQHCPFTNS